MGHARSGLPMPRGLPFLALLLVLLLAGCAVDGGSSEHSRSWTRDLLPEPFGRVSFSKDPAVFTAAWIGMIAGGAAAGWFVGREIVSGRASGDGEAAVFAILGATVVGAILGAILLTLPVRGIEALFRSIFG